MEWFLLIPAFIAGYITCYAVMVFGIEQSDK
jgi:hypothetical protein